MNTYMNEPVENTFTDDDILKEYERFNDIKKVATVFCIENKVVRQILKRNGVL